MRCTNTTDEQKLCSPVSHNRIGINLTPLPQEAFRRCNNLNCPAYLCVIIPLINNRKVLALLRDKNIDIRTLDRIREANRSNGIVITKFQNGPVEDIETEVAVIEKLCL